MLKTHIECSFRTGKNVDKIFERLVRLVLKNQINPIAPPEPPGYLGVETQFQVRKNIDKDTEDEFHCQYCGMTLTEEERLSHNCRKSP